MFTSAQWPWASSSTSHLAFRSPMARRPTSTRPSWSFTTPATGQPLEGVPVNGAEAVPPGLLLAGSRSRGRSSLPPATRAGAVRPLALVEASTPVTAISPGGSVPVELLWQAREAPGEPLVVVVQVLDEHGAVVAALEEQPVGGRYPTQSCRQGSLVRDRHTLTVPTTLSPGRYWLIAGVYRATDRQRLTTRTGY